MEYDLRLLDLEDGRCPFERWLKDVRNNETALRISRRIVRIHGGNLGDCKLLAEGVYELRLDFGPGYRVYFAFADRLLVVLLLGGDKSTQSKDISDSKRLWQENKNDSERYRRRFRLPTP